MSSENALSRDEEAAEAAALWCIRLSDDDLTEAEWEEFEAWLGKAGNADLLQDATSVWQASDSVGDQPAIIALRSEALARFHKAGQRRWFVSRTRPTKLLALAAAILLIFTASLVWFQNLPSAYATGIGERQVAMLDDGSRVSLDAVTNVEVRMKDASRQVELLEGRAKFDVAKDPLRPFTVAAGNKLIVAVGTSFSVELVDGEVRVILYEGQVEVRNRTDKAKTASAAPRRLLMTAGSQLVSAIGSSAPGVISRPDLSQSLSWEQGFINFDREPLGSAVARMNRYSTRRIRLADPALEHIPVDGIFRMGDMDAFVEGLTTLYPVKQKADGDEIVLEPK
ncbi:FecR family protein [Sphingopyxis fribergensis]